jgi:hypothetical protein
MHIIKKSKGTTTLLLDYLIHQLLQVIYFYCDVGQRLESLHAVLVVLGCDSFLRRYYRNNRPEMAWAQAPYMDILHQSSVALQ